MNNPLLSIIVPIYGVEAYLDTCIQSVLNQTFKNFELILVNDGSEDSCGIICEKYQLLDNRIQVINKTNEGLVKARKDGLTQAKGKYVAYIDGDDWISKNYYWDLIECAESQNADIVVCGHQEELEGEIIDVMLNNLPIGLYASDIEREFLYSKMLNLGGFAEFGIFSYLWNKLFRREILIPNQMRVPDDIQMAEDAACTYPAMLTANRIFISNHTGYFYRQRLNSMVKNRQEGMIGNEKIKLVYDHLSKVFNESSYKSVLIPQLKMFVLSLLIVRTDVELSLDKQGKRVFFPFEQHINPNSKLVIFGAGTFGQHLVKRLKNCPDLLMTNWVDIYYKSYQKLGLDINSPNDLLVVPFDIVLIAYINKQVAKEKKDYLLKMGIPDSKIAMVDDSLLEHIDDMMKNYKIIN